VDEAFGRLVNLYHQPHRHYHNFDHAEMTFALLGDHPPPALAFAAWLHDAVYDPRRSDNEERSAGLAREMLGPLGIPHPVIDETCRLILLTKSHLADDADGQALIDADLAILSAPEGIYEAYAAGIRREYSWVPDDEYRKGRLAVLERLLARPRIYYSPRMDEAAARRNLQREAGSLRS
jgi:predicted metal-dependent HD superfamily phosphohydrolase